MRHAKKDFKQVIQSGLVLRQFHFNFRYWLISLKEELHRVSRRRLRGKHRKRQETERYFSRNNKDVPAWLQAG